jgi:chemotaxis protein MotB
MDRKKRNIDDNPGANIGPVMTVSLFLILLTFFILLNSIAVLDEQKIRLSLGSLSGAFGSFTSGFSASNTGKLAALPSTPMIEKELEYNKLLNIINIDVKDQISLKSHEGKEIITINEKFLFDENDENKLKLKTSSYPVLNRLCDFIKNRDYPVEIAGHTDNRPAEEKGYKSNFELSALMAMQVFKYFESAGGIHPDRLEAYGCGSHRAIVSNDTRQLRAQNRRVDIILNFSAPAYIKRIYRKKPSGIFTYMKFDFRIF